MTVQQLSISGRGAERAGGWVDPLGGGSGFLCVALFPMGI